MHNHSNNNGNGGHNSKTMWLMMLFCAIPLVILLLGQGAGGEYRWFAIAGIGAFIISHYWLMRKGHKASSLGDEEKNTDRHAHEHKGHSCH